MLPDSGAAIAHDAAKRRGLAGAVAADQANQFTRADRQADAIEDATALDVDLQVRQLQHHAPFSGLRPGPDNGGYHRGIGEERIGRHVGQYGALLQRDDPVRIALDQIHVVLDLHDGADASRLRRGDQHFHDGMLVAGGDAAGRLVQQDHGRIERKGAGDIEQLLLALRQRRGDGIELAAQAQHLGDAFDVGLQLLIPPQRTERIGDTAQP